MKHIYTILFIALFVLSSCNKDASVLGGNNPILVTNDAKEINSNGLTLSANIVRIGDNNIVDYGFIIEWGGVVKKLQVKDDLKKEGEYSLRIEDNFYNGLKYNYKAYFELAEHTVMGEQKMFIGKSGEVPEIECHRPESGLINSQVTIIGKHFGTVQANNKIYFGDKEAEVISYSDSEIICLVPDVLGQFPIIAGVFNFVRLESANEFFIPYR